MKRLKVESLGDKVQAVRLRGDRRNPEPIHFRVVLPFGDVDVVRTDADDYWVHLRVNRDEDGGDPGRSMGRIVDARADAFGAEADAGFLAEPGLFHLAVRLAPAAGTP